MIPNNVVEDILRRVSIADIISQRIPLKKSGNNYTGFCPFHNDRKTPSFSVSDQKGLYHCFSCGAGGNAITFLKEYEKLDFIQALKELSKSAGIDLEPYLSDNNSEQSDLRSRLKIIHDHAQKFFIHNLHQYGNPNTKIAVATIKSRKLDKHTIQRFGIGYGSNLVNGLFTHLKNEGFTKEEIIASGLCGQTEQGKIYDRFRNRITFPIYDQDNIIVGFGGRALNKNTPAKYINSPETPLFKKKNLLYGWNLAKDQVLEKGILILVEGYLDVIRLFQAGFAYTAAPLGTGLSEDRIHFLKNKTDTLFLCFDGDEAGKKSAYRSAGLAAKIGVPVKIICLPDQEDPDTFLLKYGPDTFSDLIDNSISAEEFVIDSTKKFLPDTKKFMQSCFEYAVHLEGNIPSVSLSIETEKFLKKLSEEAGISFSSIELEFSRFKELYFRYWNPEKEYYDDTIIEETKQLELHKEAKEILSTLILFPQFADQIATIITPEDFPSEAMQNFYREILMHPERSSDEWIMIAGSSPEIHIGSDFVTIPEIRTIKNYAVRLKIKALKQKKDDISRQILLLEKENKFSQELNNQILEIQMRMIDLKKEFYFL
ncbi:MAG: DNA primase [Brevinemataceae bacterium]